jgi:four helix bundle protein
MAEKQQINSFRDLDVWKRGIQLVTHVYDVSKSFPQSELYGLTNQIRRSAVSVPSNIAEGRMRGHKAEFRQFLFIALGSLAEIETQLIIADELGYIEKEKKEQIIEEMDILGRQLRSLISKLRPGTTVQKPIT